MRTPCCDGGDAGNPRPRSRRGKTVGVEHTDDPAARLADAIARLRSLTAERTRTGRTHDDADDVAGTVDTDDAIGFDPLPLLAALDRAGARAVVIGQVAGILHGSRELTGDLDLLWSGRPGDTPSIVAAFASIDAELTDDGRGVPCDAFAFALGKVQFRAVGAAGDCCTPRLPWGGLDVAAFVERSLVTDVGGVRVHYLAIDDLVAMRRAVGRPKDLRRADELEAIVRSGR